MRVVCHHEIRFRDNCTVAEFIVVWVGGDDGETKLRLDLPDVAVKLAEQFQQPLDLAPTLRAGKFHSDFLIFEQDFVGHLDSKAETAKHAKYANSKRSFEQGLGGSFVRERITSFVRNFACFVYFAVHPFRSLG